MPLTGEAKKEYNQKYHEAQKKDKEFIANLLSSPQIPGETLSPMESWCVFNGLERGADPDEVSAGSKKGAKLNDWNKLKRFPVAGKMLDGEPATMEKWLAGRKKYRADMWELATMARGKWHEAHHKLFDCFVKKDNTTLPYKYSQDQLNDWLLAQSTKHDRLILFPRGFRKTTAILLDAVQWILNAPDINYFFCTSTRPLGKLRVQEIRNYFEVRDYNSPTDFQVWFPEFCIPEGDGEQKEYYAPITHLGVPYPQFGYTSVDSSTAGFRATHVAFDDACDEKNYREVDQRLKTIETMDAVCELLIRPFGYCQVVGTRYTDGRNGDRPEGRDEATHDTKVPDLYGEILYRINAMSDDGWEVLIEPAWRPLAHAATKAIKDYQPEDVELLMDYGPGLFSVLKKKALKNEMWFRCQQLNQPAAKVSGDEESFINPCTDENIRAASKHESLIPKNLQRLTLFVDTAMTDGRKSDWSAFAVVGYELVPEGVNPLVWFVDYRAIHAKDDVIAKTIAELMVQWNCPAMIEDIHQEGSTVGQTFKNHVLREIQLRNVRNDVKWFKPEQTPGAKETRIKDLFLLHDLGLLRFVIRPAYDLMRDMMVKYNGDKKRHRDAKSGRKDDLPDAMSYVYKILPFIAAICTPEQKEAAEKRQEQERMMRHYQFVFGMRVSDMPAPPQANISSEEVDDNPIYKALGQLGANRPQISWPKGPSKS